MRILLAFRELRTAGAGQRGRLEVPVLDVAGGCNCQASELDARHEVFDRRPRLLRRVEQERRVRRGLGMRRRGQQCHRREQEWQLHRASFPRPTETCAQQQRVGFLAAARTCGPVSDTQRLRVCRGKSPKTGQIWSLVWQITSRFFAPSHAGRCELDVPTSGTRNRRLRGCLVSFARCPRVETDLAAAVSLFHFGFRSIESTDSDRVAVAIDGGLVRNLLLLTAAACCNCC